MVKVSAINTIIKAEVSISGSKSLSNRLLMIRAISGLNLHFKNLSDSDDTVTLAKELGYLKGKHQAEINVGHAGTDMRFLTAYLANTKGQWVITGSDRMKNRPIGELVKVLNQLGADIKFLGEEGFPPLKINGKQLNGGSIEVDGSISSQFITALLLIAPTLNNGLQLKIVNESVSKPYIKMTIEVMRQFGIRIEENGNDILVHSSKYTKAGLDYYVESDWSSASYWYSVAALAKESEITLTHFNKSSLQSDSVITEIYEKLGVRTECLALGVKLTKTKCEISELEYNCIDCPDIAQTIAATCVGLGIKVTLTGLQTLKVKETDRILAMKNELEKFGAKVEVTNDSLMVIPSINIESPKAPIETYHDHRMAMSIAPLALVSGPFEIEDPDVVNKSYAAFWDDLQEAGFDID